MAVNKFYLPLVILLLLITGCNANTKTVTNTSPTLTTSPNTETTQPTTSSSSAPASVSSIATDANKEDNSVRAVGTHPDGQLLIKPASKAIVSRLGAPSCIGLETDLRWSGDYEAVWKDTSTGTSSILMTFPIDFEIVQPNNVPVEMQKFTLNKTEIFAYTPRYTDCHGLETYLFGIEGGKAFPISFEIEPGQIGTNISKFPHSLITATQDEIIITGGYGAGMESVNVYHFNYDSKKQIMIVKKIDKVKPNDITIQ